MNPDFLKHLQQITSALRGGMVFNPLDELQKRATQTGEDFGTQLEKTHAQAGYAKAHPESQRAQSEMFGNMAMLALGIKSGERPSLVPAIKTLDGKIVDGITHSHAYMDAGITEALPPKNEGYVDLAKNKFYTRQAAEKLMENFMSKSVKAQVAERSRQAGKNMGITTEDLNGKLYANRGTRADPPMTLEDMDRIVAEKKKGGAALDSAAMNVFTKVHPRDFHAAVQEFAKNRPDEAGFLSPHSPEEMQASGTRTFLSPDKKTGFAIDPSGDIQNVFNYGAKGNGAHAIQTALKNGGTKLDAFDTKLGDFYRGLGFKETGRMPWNEQYRPAGWNEEKYGKPDVINMRHPQASQLDWADTMNKWHSVWGDFQNTSHDITNLNQERRASLLAALRTPDFIVPQILKPK